MEISAAQGACGSLVIGGTRVLSGGFESRAPRVRHHALMAVGMSLRTGRDVAAQDEASSADRRRELSL
jgi:hypothetical protein